MKIDDDETIYGYANNETIKYWSIRNANSIILEIRLLFCQGLHYAFSLLQDPLRFTYTYFICLDVTRHVSFFNMIIFAIFT